MCTQISDGELLLSPGTDCTAVTDMDRYGTETGECREWCGLPPAQQVIAHAVTESEHGMTPRQVLSI